ncbi:MAG: hypothetical protein ABR987_04845 [Terracidiphilus sp.]|jgi:hypothetical protein
MPVFQTPVPPSRTQRVFCKSVAIAVLIGACVFGIREAHTCAQITDASAGSSHYLITFLISIAIAIGGFLLCVYWRTRLLGASLILAGILSSLVFFGDFAWMTRQNEVAWRKRVLTISWAIDHKCSVVVYFRKGTPRQEIDDFIATVLEQPGQPMHPEPEYPWFIREHLSLPPSLANGYEAALVDFRDTAPESVTHPYIEKIRSDPRVERLFLNVNPTKIHIDASPQ